MRIYTVFLFLFFSFLAKLKAPAQALQTLGWGLQPFLLVVTLNFDADFYELEEITKQASLKVGGFSMKGLKVSLCVGCRNDCLRIDLFCRADFYLHCWRNHFEVESFDDFWLNVGAQP